LPRSEIDVIPPQRQDVESLQPLAADHLEQERRLRRRWRARHRALRLGRPPGTGAPHR
jgi:hypothetical protein